MLLFPSNIAQNKTEIRKFVKKIRHNLYITGQSDRISKLITENILKSDIFLDSKNVMIFYPIKEEISLLGLMKCKDKNFYFPKCNGRDMLVCKQNSPEVENFSLNKYGILEPKSEPICDLSILDVIFVPALCADVNCARIGYGGGYYDRFFAKNNLCAKKVIVTSDKFLCENLPQEEFDLLCDMVICENATYFRN